MSGGSFNYLFTKDIFDIAAGVGEEWDWMLKELDDLCPEASQDMRKIKLSTEEFVKKNEPAWSKLQDLLHAVEYWRSNDYGKDQVDKAVERYRNDAKTRL